MKHGSGDAPAAGGRMSAFVLAHREALVARWEQDVRSRPWTRQLERPALRDAIPDVLEAVGRCLSGSCGETHVALGQVHALERLQQRIAPAQVAGELATLRRVLLEVWLQEEGTPPPVDEWRAAVLALDQVLEVSVARFTQARDRSFEILDRISQAAAHSSDLRSLGEQILEMIVEHTSIGCAVVALHERGAVTTDGEEGQPVLRIRAVAGSGGEDMVDRTVQPGEGLAWEVSRTGRSLGRRPAPRGEPLAPEGAGGVFVAPLPGTPRDLGVVAVSWNAEVDLPADERWLVELVARRASSIVAQVQQRQSAERRSAELTATLEAIPDAVYLGDQDGVRMANAKALHLFGYHDVESMSRDLHRLGLRVHARDPDTGRRYAPSDCAFERALRGEHAVQDAVVDRGGSGPEVRLRCAASPVQVDARTVGAVAIHTDVTERSRREAGARLLAAAGAELTESLGLDDVLDRLTRIAVPALADWCVVDLLEDGRTRRVSVTHRDPSKAALAERLTRHPPAASRLGGVAEVIRSGHPVRVRDVGPDFLSSATGSATHREIVSELGIDSILIVPLRARGRTLGALSLVSGVSGRRFEEADLAVARDLGRLAGLAADNARLYEQATRAIRAREDVLGLVSHDMRTPLGAIRMGQELLVEELGDDPVLAGQLERIGRNADRLDRLIRDLLDVAGLEAGRLQVEATPVALGPVLDEAVEIERPAAQARGIALTATVPSDVAATVLHGDRGRLLQILENLLGNAVKFCSAGDRIELLAELRDPDVEVRVCDTGPGLTSDARARIFEPYWTGRQAGSGAGLGLFIARGLVEAHGGQLAVESTLGKGTTFIIRLPRAAG